MEPKKTVSSCLESLLKPYLSNHCTTTTMASTAKTLDKMKTVEDPDVGISCFIFQLPFFCGILKQSYSDYIVNEVDMDGNVVHLTSLDMPLLRWMWRRKKKQKLQIICNRCYASGIESFRSNSGAMDAGRLEAMINQITSRIDGNSQLLA
ncbi:PREDICTED: uncharacterized protein LOC104818640 [Tarenaya hassleriana]|uniref:uncharacterized protein LOC104818640 n=1 Tax=Tarenaya hassleriana TaxID=28532 RepID=UPI00053C4FF5|nr:PREDICTED: uncharacterized protein LOC104818640 [Tarenaya hassleriana]